MQLSDPPIAPFTDGAKEPGLHCFADAGGGDMRGISVEGLSAQLVRLKKTPVKAADAAAGNGPSDAETASLIAYVTIFGHRID